MTDTGHVLVACDKFKGSLDAHEVIRHITEGIHDAAPAVEVSSVVVADGGDGTLDAAEAAGFARVPLTCTGPTGEEVDSRFALRGDEAVVEMADTCGLVRLPGGTLDPLGASSAGLGEALAAAVDAGARRIVVGIGGSASTDGGTGMLAALGVRFLDADGCELPHGGGALASLATIDTSDLHAGVEDVELVVACDVDNPLLGPTGAAAVFAPQKGADPGQVTALEAGLAHLARRAEEAGAAAVTDVPGAGAAGGVGWALLAFLGATMRPGIDIVLEMNDFASRVRGARLVVTGEGSLDRQTLLGKAPAGVAAAARAAGVPVVAVCGRALLSADEASDMGFADLAQLLDLEPDPAVCMAEAGPLLRRLSADVARRFLA